MITTNIAALNNSSTNDRMSVFAVHKMKKLHMPVMAAIIIRETYNMITIPRGKYSPSKPDTCLCTTTIVAALV